MCVRTRSLSSVSVRLTSSARSPSTVCLALSAQCKNVIVNDARGAHVIDRLDLPIAICRHARQRVLAHCFLNLIVMDRSYDICLAYPSCVHRINLNHRPKLRFAVHTQSLSKNSGPGAYSGKPSKTLGKKSSLI